ncbi:putative STAND NTPase 1 domain-containing protein [Nostoc sp. DSM 114161]|jgi:WD40 repeat protein|uniref:WD40 domain-containing protein n=1 Tax=Nostoc sp. DSM 114161 TaxID=3440143 RepID=UPI00404664FC
MNEPQSIAIDNENSLQELLWALATSQKEFSLILALCNAASLRRRLMQSLQASSDLEIREIVLDKSIKTFFQTIHNLLGSEHPQTLVVSGLESVTQLEQVLSGANQVREEFRKNFHFPLVLWVTDDVLHKLMRLAPDLHSWSTTVEFAIATDDLIDFIEQTADDVFEKILEAGAGRYLDSTALNLQVGSPRRVELESAWHDLQNRRLNLNPELEASLEFMLGRANSNSLELSRQYYERSLALFVHDSPSPRFLERRGCLLYSLGLWWRTYALLNYPEKDLAIGFAKDYFQECIEVFEQANREDLVAKFINALGSVLQSLQQWEELEAVANKAIALHQTYPNQFKLARAYSYLAEVLIAKSAWNEAKQTAEEALSLLDNVQIDMSLPISEEMKADLDWERSYHRGWYLFALARSQSALNQPEAALQTLETARTETKVQYDPELYIQILAELRTKYFQKGEYRTAFHLKQEGRSLEQQYRFRAFIGAGRLQAQQIINNPALPSVEQQATVATEIAASGRQQDINRLIERMAQHDRKLTIIHGQSGVGKSSILQAGLIPALKQRSIGIRDVLPVLQQVYPDWIIELGNRLRDALADLPRIPYEGRSYEYSPIQTGDIEAQKCILNQLEKHDNYNLLTVLIFDQFEEFFFIYKDPSSRRKFYEFLRECLDIPYVKVILSLREDYLHYLLECNNRLASFDVINNNILDKDILYYLDNFSLEDAKLIIQNLTQNSQLVLETLLIDELVKDLARDLGEVRPIELQVVGAQLQTEKITKLEQYQQHGLKENFVGRFLEEIVKDCGADNEQIAKLVLYLLTDENNTRPLKTRADLELELDIKTEKLDLVLEILVKSGLVLRVPASPADRYQLVHDYLVPFVRQQQSARLIAELEKEREQRKLTEAKLNEVLKQQLLETRQGLLWKVTLGTISGALAIFLPVVLVSQNNTQLTSMSTEVKGLLKSNQDLEALVKSIKAGKQLQQWWSLGVKPETEIQVKAALQDVVYTIKERNTLEGHSDTVTSVSFSPDGKMVVSGSADGVVIIWNRNGKKIKDFKAHEKKITSLGFSPNSQSILSASEDKTLKLWSLEGKEIANFKGHKEEITCFSFSPDGQKVISGSQDKTLKIWKLDGTEIKTFRGHKQSIKSVTFSPNGQTIASISIGKIMKLWSLDGKETKTLNDAGDSVNFSPDGQTIVGQDNGNIILRRSDASFIKLFYTSSSDKQSLVFSGDGKTIYLPSFYYDDLLNKSNIVQTSILQVNTGKTLNFEFAGHRNKITSVTISPDGKTIASGSEDKTVKLWNLESRNFQLLYNKGSTVINKVIFNHNGQIFTSIDTNNELKIWQRNGTLKTTLPGNNLDTFFSKNSYKLFSASQFNKLQLWQQDGTFINNYQGEFIDNSFSPDKRTIALVRNDNTVELFSIDSKITKILKGHRDKVFQIIFSPNGETLATASEDKTVKLWRQDGTPIASLNNLNKVSQINFSPDGKIVVTASEDKSIKLWRSDGTLITSLIGDIINIGFSHNSETLAIWDNDNTIKFLRKDGKLIKNLKSDQEMSVNFIPDGEIIVIQNRVQNNAHNGVELWSMDGSFLAKLQNKENSRYIREFSFIPDSQIMFGYNDRGKLYFWKRDGSIISSFDKRVVSLSPDYQTLVTVEGDDKVKLWKRNGTAIRTIQLKNQKTNLIDIYSSNTPDIKFSPDGQILVIYRDSSTVEMWRIDGTFLKSFECVADKNIDQLGNDTFCKEQPMFSFRSDSKTLAIRTNKNEVQFWAINSNGKTKVKLLKTIKGQTNRIERIEYIPNSNKIAIIGSDDVVKIWQLPEQSGKEAQLLKILPGHKNFINNLSISSKSGLLASASDDNTVKLWRGDGTLFYNFAGHKKKVNSISFSPEGQLIASASDDKSVKVWQLDGKVIKSFEEHGNKVTSVSFSPDGKTIVSASQDNTIKLWSIDSKDSKSSVTLNGEEPINSVSFSPDGKMIASAGVTKVKLWSIDGTLLTTYDRFGNIDASFAAFATTNVTFSPDGKSIASGGDEISVWDFDLNQLLKRGCEIARDYLENNPKAESDRHICDDIK